MRDYVIISNININIRAICLVGVKLALVGWLVVAFLSKTKKKKKKDNSN